MLCFPLLFVFVEIYLFLFADDHVMFAQTNQDMIYKIQTFIEDFKKREMTLNVDKIEYMYIEEQQGNIQFVPETIKHCNTIKIRDQSSQVMTEDINSRTRLEKTGKQALYGIIRKKNIMKSANPYFRKYCTI